MPTPFEREHGKAKEEEDLLFWFSQISGSTSGSRNCTDDYYSINLIEGGKPEGVELYGQLHIKKL